MEVLSQLVSKEIHQLADAVNDSFLEFVVNRVFCLGSADSEVSEEQKKEKVAELKKKEKELQDTLKQKLEELKKLCMREAVSIRVVQRHF